MNSSGSASAAESKRSDHSRGWRHWLDVAFKLSAPVGVILTALAAIAASFLVNSFQAKTTAFTLQNQREQSETSLRAAMFGYLISPIVGVQTSGAKIDANRYRLLVEMLALNFHENVEFKPLMEDADRRLALMTHSSVDAKEAKFGRESLRSISRRVVDRQLAKLKEDPSASCPDSRKNPSTVDFDVVFADGDKSAESTVETLCEIKNGCVEEKSPRRTKEGSTIVTFFGSVTALANAGNVVSPDCKDQLAISFSNPDEENHRIMAQFSVYKLDPAGQTSPQGTPISFALTPYNFPFTDNTLLADGNRFAIYFLDVDSIGDAAKSFHVGLRWFPKDYFSPRERPTDFQQTRKLLGISVDAGQ